MTYQSPSNNTTTTTRKIVAKSLKDAVNTDLMTALLDRSRAIDDDTWLSLCDRWNYDLYSRRPGPALLRDGDIKPTDLDLAAFLSALADRKAIVQIPHYTARRQASGTNKNQINLSTDFRRGRINGVTSNKEVFSFSLRVEDMSVMTASLDGGKLGAPRNFMILDVDGDWYSGWDQIDFVPTEKENDFIQQFQLAMGDSLVFEKFVSPNRWTSFYGEDFLIAKTAIARAEQETSFLRQEKKRLANFAPQALHQGPRTLAGNQEYKDPRPTKTVEVNAFESEVDVPFGAEFESIVGSTTGYNEAKERENFLQYTILPRLRFATRATEYAFFRHLETKGPTFPAWVKNAKWETGFRLPRGRTDWNRLVLTQQKVGQPGIAIRYRLWTKTEEVTGR